MTARKADIVDLPNWPRLLSREQAAAYCGLSPVSFIDEVEAGTFPRAIFLSGTRRKLWDRAAIDRALDAKITGNGGEFDERKRRAANQDRPPSPRGRVG